MNTIYLLEVIEGLGITVKPIKAILQINDEMIGKVIDNKCYGYTEEQCLKTFDNYCNEKIEEIRKRSEEENQKYWYMREQIRRTFDIIREPKYKEEVQANV